MTCYLCNRPTNVTYSHTVDWSRVPIFRSHCTACAVTEYRAA